MDQPQQHARKATWRLDARLRGRIQAGVIALVVIILFFIFRPIYLLVVGTKDLQTCQVNMLKIARAFQQYAADWDETYPPANSWMTSALGNITATSGTGFQVSKYFQCPLDKSGSPSSYVYNDLLAGIAPNIQYPAGSPEEQRRAGVRFPPRMPLVIEKHGSPDNAHVTLHNWDEVIKAMDLPHQIPDPVGSLINGVFGVERKADEQLRNSAGKRF